MKHPQWIRTLAEATLAIGLIGLLTTLAWAMRPPVNDRPARLAAALGQLSSADHYLREHMLLLHIGRLDDTSILTRNLEDITHLASDIRADLPLVPEQETGHDLVAYYDHLLAAVSETRRAIGRFRSALADYRGSTARLAPEARILDNADRLEESVDAVLTLETARIADTPHRHQQSLWLEQYPRADRYQLVLLVYAAPLLALLLLVLLRLRVTTSENRNPADLLRLNPYPTARYDRRGMPSGSNAAMDTLVTERDSVRREGAQFVATGARRRWPRDRTLAALAVQRDRDGLNRRKEKEQAQITPESIGDGVITTDHEGIINYLNPSPSSSRAGQRRQRSACRSPRSTVSNMS